MMSTHAIEIEVRGEIRLADIPALERRLRTNKFRHASSTRRTSVMTFGEAHARGTGWDEKRKEEIDVRCRITNGKAEVVAKIGRTDAPNRTEIPINVSCADMIRFARLFGAMGFYTKVGSRCTENYVRGAFTVSLVSSPSGLAYIEIEKMSTKEREHEDEKEVRAVAQELGVTLWKTRQQFLTFCDQLTARDDWEFCGTEDDVQRLRAEIQKAGSGR